MNATSTPHGTSTRPYLIRALHEWCADNGYTPYLAVYVDERVQVPAEYVKNHEIVLNVGYEATQALKLGNELIEFSARFGGRSRDISVPVDHVIAIYARENGQGMAFPMPEASGSAPQPSAVEIAASAPTGSTLSLTGPPQEAGSEPPDAPGPAAPRRPSLKRVK
jgi:stringent starvation protein B